MAKERVWVTSLSVVILLVLIGVSGYLGNLVSKMETMEDKLGYGQLNKQHATVPQLKSATPEGAMMRTTYIPSYSHVYGDGGKPLLLESALIVRNTDSEYGMTIHSVNYYDSSGHLVKEMLATPIQLNPLASAEYLAEKSDISGGSGANYLVVWSAVPDLTPPILEAVMVGSSDYTEVSFTSRGITH
ncbi:MULTISPECIES: DUF3124 domain-containing protein [Corallincola]|uniref:DUF3124 domain-containing protein n=2 Tax=Corallincola TaxID=1775176 RepID=A0ABY1WLY0_9GAMM|nr:MULTISPECIES: DUF3124 domain-containing protein [Corallincola]TAA42590.1 DUF3124 domain-containing protein [Corallincola spongiicola]TCI01283.1 DUF3124 domain-containing protein [Corallincola luteus]